jgi:iron complex outermembrane recepter protein
LNYNINEKLRFMLDLQYRGVRYSFEGLDFDGSDLYLDMRYSFFNPKAGIGYQLSKDLAINYYFAIANREPNREDFVASDATSSPRSERLFDNELIIRYGRDKLSLKAVGYFMKYKDQLAVTGQLNEVGALKRVNIEDSYRLGIELSGTYSPVTRLDLTLGATLSQNSIKKFDEYIYDFDTESQFVVTHTDVDLAFSPSSILMGSAGYQFLQLDKHAATIGLMTKFVGTQYVDNTGNPASLISSYAFTDLQLQYAFKWKDGKELKVNMLIRNIFDGKYVTNAWNFRFKSANYNPVPNDPYTELESGDIYHQRGYFPQSGRNVLVGLSLLF